MVTQLHTDLHAFNMSATTNTRGGACTPLQMQGVTQWSQDARGCYLDLAGLHVR